VDQFQSGRGIERALGAERQVAGDLADLLTPVIKAFCTDMGFDAANAAMQVFGGHGYIRDHGMEQFVRDARINQTYEGANGVQALDLVGRKLARNAGRAPFALFKIINDFIAAETGEAMKPFIAPLKAGVDRLQDATIWLAQNGLKNADTPAPRRSTTCACSGWSPSAISGRAWRKRRKRSWLRTGERVVL